MQMLCAFPSLIYTLKNALDLRIRIEFSQLFVELIISIRKIPGNWSHVLNLNFDTRVRGNCNFRLAHKSLYISPDYGYTSPIWEYLLDTRWEFQRFVSAIFFGAVFFSQSIRKRDWCLGDWVTNCWRRLFFASFCGLFYLIFVVVVVSGMYFSHCVLSSRWAAWRRQSKSNSNSNRSKQFEYKKYYHYCRCLAGFVSKWAIRKACWGICVRENAKIMKIKCDEIERTCKIN